MLEIRILKPDMEQALVLFFNDIVKDDYAHYYHPYSLTPETAKKLCNLSGKDLHYVLTDNKVILGHGMLRGWDEGYNVPSLGIVIHPDVVKKGLGNMFIRFLHSSAWLKDCSSIRLSVYKENIAALNIYEKLGYVFVQKNKRELTGTLLRKEGK